MSEPFGQFFRCGTPRSSMDLGLDRNRGRSAALNAARAVGPSSNRQLEEAVGDGRGGVGKNRGAAPD